MSLRSDKRLKVWLQIQIIAIIGMRFSFLQVVKCFELLYDKRNQLTFILDRVRKGITVF